MAHPVVGVGRESDLESCSCTCSELDREGRAVWGGEREEGTQTRMGTQQKKGVAGEKRSRREVGSVRSGGVIARAGDGETGVCLRHWTRDVAEGAG